MGPVYFINASYPAPVPERLAHAPQQALPDSRPQPRRRRGRGRRRRNARRAEAPQWNYLPPTRSGYVEGEVTSPPMTNNNQGQRAEVGRAEVKHEDAAETRAEARKHTEVKVKAEGSAESNHLRPAPAAPAMPSNQQPYSMTAPEFHAGLKRLGGGSRTRSADDTSSVDVAVGV